MSGLDEIFRSFKDIRTPTVDRVCVADLRVLHDLSRRDASPLPGQLPDSLAGIPVFVDDSVEVGAIELRLGDKLVERMYLPELRA